MSQPNKEEKVSQNATVTSLPSFSKDLWHAFEPIVERLERGNRSLDEFLVFIRERILAEQQYAKAIEKVCKKPCGTSEAGETLKIALDSIRGDLSNEHAQRVEYANNLILEVYDPGLTMKALYSKMNRKFMRDGRRAIKEFRNAQNKFKKIRIKHERIVEDLVQSQECLLGAQSSPSDANSKEIIKLASRVNLATKADTESKERFEDAKREIQQEYQRYFDTLSSILAGMQSNEEARINYTRGALRKIVIFDTSLVANRQYDTNGMAAIMENVNQIEDLSSFIEDTLKKHPYPSPAPPTSRRPLDQARARVANLHRRYNSEPPPNRERRGSVDSNASDDSTASDLSVESNISSASSNPVRIAPLPQPSQPETPQAFLEPKTSPQRVRGRQQSSPADISVTTSPASHPSYLPQLQPPMPSNGSRRSPSMPSRSRTLPNGLSGVRRASSEQDINDKSSGIVPPERMASTGRLKTWLGNQQARLKDQKLPESPIARNFRQLKSTQFLKTGRSFTWGKTKTQE